MIGIEVEALDENTDHDLDKPATPKLEGGTSMLDILKRQMSNRLSSSKTGIKRLPTNASVRSMRSLISQKT